MNTVLLFSSFLSISISAFADGYLDYPPTQRFSSESSNSLDAGNNYPWIILKDSWSLEDELNYSNFVQKLGESKCSTVMGCIKSEANPYRNTDKPGYNWAPDCGRFGYFLRVYFAWKNNLPFSYVSEVSLNDGSEGTLQASSNGNHPEKRRSVLRLTPDAKILDGPFQISKTIDDVYSPMYRISPEFDGGGEVFPDFYPVAIRRSEKNSANFIHPGTLIYNPNGHVMTVYKVTPDGRIFYIDAKSDGVSVTHHELTPGEYPRSRPQHGGGFKNWRPLQLVGYTKIDSGELIGGTIIGATNANLPDFSDEEYYGSVANPTHDLSKVKYTLDGIGQLEYYDFVRGRLTVGGSLKYNPIDEIKSQVNLLCGKLTDRVIAIQTGAVEHHLTSQIHPTKLPNNIFSAEDDWEQFATPSRDTDIRGLFLALRQNVQRYWDLFRGQNPILDYTGQNLAKDMLTTYSSMATRCDLSYKNSSGDPIKLSFNEMPNRVFKMSFDPYFCVELLWGAPLDGEEIKSCHNLDLRWYQAEEKLRNMTVRDIQIKTGMTAEQLKDSNVGVAQSPDIDTLKYLEKLTH